MFKELEQALSKDSEILDWIEENDARPYKVQCVERHWWQMNGNNLKADNIRELIMKGMK